VQKEEGSLFDCSSEWETMKKTRTPTEGTRTEGGLGALGYHRSWYAGVIVKQVVGLVQRKKVETYNRVQ